jgi:hypothetical protein
MKTNLLLLTALVLIPLTAQAQPENVFCTQVFPCDDEGNLLPQYLDPENPCFEFFASQCKQQVEAVEKNSLCEETSHNVEKLQGTIKRLKDRLRAQRRLNRHR